MSAVLLPLAEGALNVVGGILKPIPKGSIGGITVQATLEEIGTDTLQVTENPVEAGAQITDHAFVRPCELIMRCGWSNSSLNNLIGAAISLFSGGGVAGFSGLSSSALVSTTSSTGFNGLAISDYVSSIYSQLLSLQQSLQPFTVVTSIRQYSNMMLTSVSLTRDQKTSQSLMVTATMKQVILVSTQTTTIAPQANQANPSSTSETQNVGPQSLQSGSPNPGGSVPPSGWD